MPSQTTLYDIGAISYAGGPAEGNGSTVLVILGGLGVCAAVGLCLGMYVLRRRRAQGRLEGLFKPTATTTGGGGSGSTPPAGERGAVFAGESPMRRRGGRAGAGASPASSASPDSMGRRYPKVAGEKEGVARVGYLDDLPEQGGRAFTVANPLRASSGAQPRAPPLAGEGEEVEEEATVLAVGRERVERAAKRAASAPPTLC